MATANFGTMKYDMPLIVGAFVMRMIQTGSGTIAKRSSVSRKTWQILMTL